MECDIFIDIVYWPIYCPSVVSEQKSVLVLAFKNSETPGISIHLCAWEREYPGRKHYGEPLTNKRWETKGRTKRRKSITGAMMERKTSILCAFRGSEWERERKTEPWERGKELRWEREGGLRIKRGSLNEIIWKKSKTMREAFRETDKGESGRLSTNWAGGKKSRLVSAVNSAQTDLQFCFQHGHKDFWSPLMCEHTVINIIILPANVHKISNTKHWDRFVENKETWEINIALHLYQS